MTCCALLWPKITPIMLIDLTNDQLLVSKIKSVWPNRSILKVKFNTVWGHSRSNLESGHFYIFWSSGRRFVHGSTDGLFTDLRAFIFINHAYSWKTTVLRNNGYHTRLNSGPLHRLGPLGLAKLWKFSQNSPKLSKNADFWISLLEIWRDNDLFW